MRQADDLIGALVFLRPLTIDDVSAEYVAWLNDPEVNAYSEYRHQHHTLESVRADVARICADARNAFFVIIECRTGVHVGNVKLGPVDTPHHRASIGSVIGKQFWGRGYASDAIALIEQYAFRSLDLHKLTAGMYATNRGSFRVFEKCGFSIEGRRLAHCLQGDQWVDYIEMGKVCTA